MAFRIFKRLRELLDVDTSGAADGDSLTYDAGSDLWVPAAVSGGGGSDDQTAAEVPFTPAGNIAATDVQAALEELDTEKATPAQITSAISALSSVYQPLDSDLTAIAALTTTSFGRGLLALADAAAGRTALGLGTAATSATGDFDAAGAAAAAQAASQPLDSDLTAIAALTTTSFGRGLLALADAAALRTSAGLVIGTDVQAHDADLDTYAGITPSANVQSLLGAANYAAIRTLLGLVIGTDVEAHDADLTTIAGLVATNDDILQRKAGAWTNRSMAQLIADLAALGTTFQPLDSDLTSIAALATTSFGRALLALADPADATKFLDGTGAYDTVKDSDLSTSDITTNNVSITKHGFAPKAPNDATKYLDGTGAYTVPAGGGGSGEVNDANLVIAMEVYLS